MLPVLAFLDRRARPTATATTGGPSSSDGPRERMTPWGLPRTGGRGASRLTRTRSTLLTCPSRLIVLRLRILTVRTFSVTLSIADTSYPGVGHGAGSVTSTRRLPCLSGPTTGRTRAVRRSRTDRGSPHAAAPLAIT